MKNVMMMILMMGFVLTTQAQSGQRGPGPDSEKERMEKAKEHLELSDAQYKQWQEVHQKYEKEIEALRSERAEGQEKGKALKEKIDSELNEILTDEQKKKFAEVKQRGKNGKRPKGRKPGGQ